MNLVAQNLAKRQATGLGKQEVGKLARAIQYVPDAPREGLWPIANGILELLPKGRQRRLTLRACHTWEELRSRCCYAFAY